MLKTILVATSNQHKLSEISQILAPLNIEVVGLDSINIPDSTVIPEPEENGTTFAQNARIKALYYAKHTNKICLADDSGLEVDALNGAPGIYSARYAGTHATDVDRNINNNNKLLNELSHIKDEKDRTARFVCNMCLAAPNGKIIAETRDTLEGTITHTPNGTGGFGYDPIVYLPTHKKTVAQLNADEKNKVSHRGKATRAMYNKIELLNL